MGATISAPASRARSMNPAMIVLVPAVAAIAASAYDGPSSVPKDRNLPSGVGTGENVFVSCFIIAITTRISSLPTSYRIHATLR